MPVIAQANVSVSLGPDALGQRQFIRRGEPIPDELLEFVENPKVVGDGSETDPEEFELGTGSLPSRKRHEVDNVAKHFGLDTSEESSKDGAIAVIEANVNPDDLETLLQDGSA